MNGRAVRENNASLPPDAAVGGVCEESIHARVRVCVCVFNQCVSSHSISEQDQREELKSEKKKS